MKVLWLIAGCFTSLIGRPGNFSTETIVNELVRAGYENVYVQASDSVLTIGYENRRYRFEPEGTARLIQLVDKYVNPGTFLRIILYFQEIPQLIIEFPIDLYRLFKKHLLDEKVFYDVLSVQSIPQRVITTDQRLYNPARFRGDIVVIPQMRAQFGDFDRPVQINFNLIPELNVHLAKGLTLKSQWLFPAYNNFLIPEQAETKIRPAVNTINYLAHLEDKFLIRISGGLFNRERAGVDMEVKKYFGSDQWAIGMIYGYTGYYSFIEKITEYFEKDSYLTAILSVEYFHRPYDLTIRMMGGNFLYNDLAIRADILRQFGEVQIGFFSSINQRSEWNGGFNFAIPIPPRKYQRIKHIRIRPADAFRWEYRAKGFTSDARLITTGMELYDLRKEYNPEFFKKRLIIAILD